MKALTLIFLISMSLLISCGENTILIPGEEVVILSESQEFKFLEGPVFDGKYNLYFSDIPNENINIYNVDTESFQLFKSSSNKSNGLMFNSAGQLIACESGVGKIVVLSASGSVEETLASTFNDIRFNSPNDLVIDSEGGVYFTDPTWGDLHQGLTAVYYIEPGGSVKRLIDDMIKPNGVIFSPDGKNLYINDSYGSKVRMYEILSPGELSSSYIDLELTSVVDNISMADGMTMDVKGNLYVTTGTGIQVFDKNQQYLLTIEVPEIPANCTFGGDNMQTLYITARKNLYSIRLNNKGVSFPLK